MTNGPYAIIRHPMYLGWTIAYVGLALAGDNGWLALLLPALFALVRREARHEEQALRRRFGTRPAPAAAGPLG